MGNFYWDGQNSIFDSLVSQLPNGKVYFKENNIIPAIEQVTFSEQFIQSFPMVCKNNTAGLDVGGETLVLNISGVIYSVTFTTTTGGTDIINQINAVVPIASITSVSTPYGVEQRIQLHYINHIITIIGGTALVDLGYTTGENGIVGTKVSIYVNDILNDIVEVLPGNNSIYYKFKPPFGRFTMKTVIQGSIYKNQDFISLNIFMFLNVLSMTYQVSYEAIFNMFGNIWDKYLQNDWLYNKIGWYYDFDMPYGWNIDDYRRIIVGQQTNIPPIPINGTYSLNWCFMNSMTYQSILELVRAFTGTHPIIETYRDTDGWLVQDDSITQIWNLPSMGGDLLDYYVMDYTVGTVDGTSGYNVSGKTLNLTVNGIFYSIVFTDPDPIPMATILTTINSIVPGNIATSVNGNYYIDPASTVYTNPIFLKLGTVSPPVGWGEIEGQLIIDASSDCLSDFGLSSGEVGIVVVNGDNEVATLYDEAFHNNKINLRIKQASYRITETVTRSTIPSGLDQLRHKYIITTPTIPLIHDFIITSLDGTVTYTMGVDYTVVETNDISYINWISVMPDANYLCTYNYFMKDEIEPLCEKIKPAYLKINYYYSE